MQYHDYTFQFQFIFSFLKWYTDIVHYNKLYNLNYKQQQQI